MATTFYISRFCIDLVPGKMAEDGNRGTSPSVATHGQTTEDSVALPYELLVHGVLRMLDVADLLRCKLVSLFLNAKVKVRDNHDDS